MASKPLARKPSPNTRPGSLRHINLHLSPFLCPSCHFIFSILFFLVASPKVSVPAHGPTKFGPTKSRKSPIGHTAEGSGYVLFCLWPHDCSYDNIVLTFCLTFFLLASIFLFPDESAVPIPNPTIRNQLKTWDCLMTKIWYAATLRCWSFVCSFHPTIYLTCPIDPSSTYLPLFYLPSTLELPMYSYLNLPISTKRIRRSNPSMNVWSWTVTCKAPYKRS